MGTRPHRLPSRSKDVALDAQRRIRHAVIAALVVGALRVVWGLSFATARAWGRADVAIGAAVFALAFALRSGRRRAAVTRFALQCSSIGAVAVHTRCADLRAAAVAVPKCDRLDAHAAADRGAPRRDGPRRGMIAPCSP